MCLQNGWSQSENASLLQIRIVGYQQQKIVTSQRFKSIQVLFDGQRYAYDITKDRSSFPQVSQTIGSQSKCEIVLQGEGIYQGKFIAAYKNTLGFASGAASWTRNGSQITIYLPFWSQAGTYVITESLGATYLQRLEASFAHTTKFKKNTDQFGQLKVPLILDKNNFRLKGAKIKRVTYGNIRIELTSRTLVKENSRLYEKLQELERLSRKKEKAVEKLEKERDELKKGEKASEEKMKQLNEQIDSYERDITQVKGIIIDLFEDDNKRKEYLANNDTASITQLKELAEKVRQANQDVRKAETKLQEKEKEKKEVEEKRFIEKRKANEAIRDANETALKQKNIILASILLIVIILLGAFLRQKSTNKILKEQQSLLQIQKTQLTDQTNTLAKKNAKLNEQSILIELLMSEMRHRLLNEFIAIGADVSFVASQLTEQTSKQSLQDLERRIKHSISVQRSLTYPLKSKTSNHYLSKREVKLRLTEIAHAHYDFHIKNSGEPPQIVVNVEQVEEKKLILIGFCVSELVLNACKYSFDRQSLSNLRVSIELVQEGDKLVLKVVNNGRGFDPDLFENQSYVFEKPTSSKGMRIIKQIMDLENGQFDIHTTGVHQLNEGSRIVCVYRNRYPAAAPPDKLATS
ncbi:hypothetical protein BKI52_11780 [marine bacterium AO1-C]|nr:hypothetical protein BKI52_11780 [marine bacterium AO1-C]